MRVYVYNMQYSIPNPMRGVGRYDTRFWLHLSSSSEVVHGIRTPYNLSAQVEVDSGPKIRLICLMLGQRVISLFGIAYTYETTRMYMLLYL